MHPQQAQIHAKVFDLLKALAPEIDPAKIIPDKPLRGQIDLDSMDWLNVLAAIHEKFGIEVLETDYGKVATLEGMLAYLAAKIPAGPAA